MTSNSSKKRLRQPLLVKLFFVFMLTGILLLSAVAGYILFVSKQASETPHHFLRRGLQKCTASLAMEIGTPPDYEHAQALSDQLGLEIRIVTPKGETWQSSTANFEKARSFRVNHDGTIFTFFLQPPPPPMGGLLQQILWLIAILSVILVVSFLVIRWIFKPLRRVMEGVEAIGQGQLDYQMTVRPRDEFGAIATAFNQMTGKVKEMIQAREQLLSDLSHELRSPLTRMQVSSEFIEKPELKESLKEDLREIDEMIGEVLEAARLSSPHGGIVKEPVDLRALMKDLVAKYHATQPGVSLEDSIAGQIAVNIVGDAHRLKSALRNLVENALKYSAQQSKAVEVRLAKVDGAFEIEVKDYGIGIPDGEQGLIFEAFYRVDKSRTRITGGFGLGLNLCKKIIEAHGGKITVESKPGEGSTFKVQLPT